MKIIKYQKKNNNNYEIIFENNEKITLHEDIILKYKLLYKQNIDSNFLEKIINDNNNYKIYDKCIKYISIRLRSINEIKEYLKRNNIEDNLSQEIIEKLKRNNQLNDEIFTKAFINDKLKFTTMGPYRIELELQRHNIDNDIIKKYIHEIDEEILKEKINKQITKLIKNKKNKNIIYNKLLNLGYSSEFILSNLNNYNL